MAGVVFDSSAVIALLRSEPGAAFIRGFLRQRAAISAVNVQEVAKKYVETGMPIQHARELVESLDLDIVAHELDDAYLAATLAAATRQHGRGLGDRSCMALAIRLGVPAITTDRAWARIEVSGLEVILAR